MADHTDASDTTAISLIQALNRPISFTEACNRLSDLAKNPVDLKKIFPKPLGPRFDSDEN